MENRYKIITISMLTFVLVYTLIYFKAPQPKFEIKDPPEETIYLVEGLTDVQQILWNSKNELTIATEKEVYKYNITQREKRKVADKMSNSIIGLEGEDVVVCEYENRVINSPEENSTTMNVFRNGSLIVTIEVHPTIKPVTCNATEVIATTSISKIEEKYFRVDFSQQTISEIAKPTSPYTIEGTEKTLLLIGDFDIEIPKTNNFTAAAISPDMKKVSLIDSQNRVWIYFKE